ncbi:MAG: tetratricopeptide repeat protein [Candidatus Shapirobacteria bacterium]|nr:tetratricopeptide repeat protein [Candidatus Shapirobacteria bacterium]
MKTIAHKLHQKAEELREQDKHIQALKACDEALITYQKEKNYLGICSLIQSRVLIYKHLFLLTQDFSFFVLAMKDVESSLLISQKFNLNNLYSCYFRLGEIFMLSDDYKNAIINYKKALKLYPKIDSEKGDYQYHLGEAQYRSGNKKDGLKNILIGLKIIQKYQSKTDSFLIHVWESGCYLRLAELLYKDNPIDAQKYLHQAKEIIDADKKLIIRKRQLKDLAINLKIK